MAKGLFGTVRAVTDGREIRKVLGDDGLLLEPNEQPYITYMSQIRKKTSIDATKIEKFQDVYIPQWGTFDANALIGATTLSVGVTNASYLREGQIITIPVAVSSSAKGENVRVLVVDYAAGTFTCTRAFSGTTNAAITAGDSYSLTGSAYAENADLPESRFTIPTPITTYTQIFRETYKLSKSANAKPFYGAMSGERKLQHEKMLKQTKIEMNRAMLHSKAATTTDPVSGEALRSTMGLDAEIQTNRTNAGGAITQTVMESFARSVFRYGGPTRVLVSCPVLVSAMSFWGNGKLFINEGETKYGVKIARYITGHGEFEVLRDWTLVDGIAGKNGFGGWAFAVDPSEIEMFVLKGNGENREVTLTQNLQTNGRDGYVDEILTEQAQMVKHEEKHGKLYNITSYA